MFLLQRVEIRNCFQQATGVRIFRTIKDFCRRSCFYHFSGLHHNDFIGKVTNDAEVMSDEQVRDISASLDFVQKIQDLGLHGNIQSRCRFITNQKFGFDHQRTSYRQALSLSAENSCGYRFNESERSPQRPMTSSILPSASLAGISGCRLSNPSSRISLTRILGFKLENGSWKITCISTRACRRSGPFKLPKSFPFKSAEPVIFACSRRSWRMPRATVVLPLPLSPINAVVSPLRTSNETLLTALAYSVGRRKPPRIGNQTL